MLSSPCTKKRARQEAEEAARAIRAGQAKGPLHGLPIAIKDLIEIEGGVTTRGSLVFKDRVSTHTATLVKKLKDAGMIVLGKTHTVEFAYGAWGTNQHMGTPWNPWDANIARTPGGSSSGSGVAVAARMTPAALGYRYRRFGAHSRGLVRDHGPEDQRRPHQHLWRAAAQPDPGHAGPAGAVAWKIARCCLR